MVLTLLQDVVKLMFEMTNASECHRDAVCVCGGDRFVVFDRSAETGDWCQACDLRFSVTRRRVAGEAGFDVTYLRRRSERRAVRPILPLTLTLNLRSLDKKLCQT